MTAYLDGKELPTHLEVAIPVPAGDRTMKFAATLFFDVGGVLLTNGWDTEAREAAIAQFGLNGLDFHTRHAMLRSAFETGRLSLDQYLQKAVFFRPQTFKPDEFKAFMFEQSQLLP